MRYLAFLRAINVGGRVVKMDNLRRLFSSMGFTGVETFIASGNVIFESPSKSSAKLETTIEAALEKALGYHVGVFLRSPDELSELARHPLVSGEKVPTGSSLYVGFLRADPGKEFATRLAAFNSDVDDFQVHQRQVLWTVRGNLLESKASSAKLEKTFTMPVTFRNATTVRKMAAKYGASAPAKRR